MSDKKVFAINPELFSFSNTTKKKKKKAAEPASNKIKVKQPASSSKNATMRKSAILRMIREQQSKLNEQQLMQPVKPIKNDNINTSAFNDAKDFFENMTVQNKQTNNITLKNNGNKLVSNEGIRQDLELNNVDINVGELPETNKNTVQLNSNKVEIPKYGCLKNGNLPTYRDYMNMTRKQVNDEEIEKIPEKTVNNYNHLTMADKANIHEQHNKLGNMKKKKKRFQKKIIRKTYKLGKSKLKPNISVLISNRTVRNNITEKKQKLQQVQIVDIRRYLMKHGLIKVGTTTPNDVLRSMYESALLICGEIQNHNAENLMYNFINNVES